MEDKALIELLKDMLAYKKREARYLFFALIFVIVINLATVGAFLFYESQMETSVTTTTEQRTSGSESDSESDIVNGDQYNDESQNRSK